MHTRANEETTFTQLQELLTLLYFIADSKFSRMSLLGVSHCQCKTIYFLQTLPQMALTVASRNCRTPRVYVTYQHFILLIKDIVILVDSKHRLIVIFSYHDS